MAEKIWRLDVSNKIESFIENKNMNLRESLDLRHSRSDVRFFGQNKAHYLEEDIFKYFYPFCITNCAIGSLILLRKSHFGVILFGVAGMVEYVYFLFAFPVENWFFHKRAISTSQPYAQLLRDSYIQRFPSSEKAKMY